MDRLINMSMKTKKRLTNISTGIFFLFGGIEYAIIMPTVFLYIQDLGGDPSFLGLVLAAFSFSGLIAAPIFGILQDRYHNTKTLVLFANCFEIIGNFMYFMGINLMMLLGSRLIAGIGAGVGSSLFAQIARTTTEADRAASISMAMAARQIGLLFGPGLNIFLEKVDFVFLSFEVDALSSAGLFMCLLWLLLQIFIFLFYFDLPPLSDEEIKAPNNNSVTSTESSSPTRTDPVSEISKSVNILDSGRPKPRNKSIMSQSLPTGGSNVIGSYEEKGGVVNVAPMWGSSHLVEDARPRAFSTTSVNQELQNPSDTIQVRQDLLQNVDLDDSDNLYDEPNEDGLSQEFPGLDTVKDDTANGSSGYGSHDHHGSGDSNQSSARNWKDEYLREEIVVLLASQFIFFFNQTVLETALTPMTQRLLNFGELENSIFYCICGVEVVIGFIVVKYLSKYVSDRYLLLTGFIIELVSCIWLLIWYPQATPDFDHKARTLWWFGIGVIIEVSGLAFLAVSTISLYSKLTPMETQGKREENFLSMGFCCIVQISGLPFIAVANISLFSKITSKETQGFSQGIRRAVGGLATIMGPLWAGSTVLMGYVMFGVMTFLFTFIIILMLISWKKLVAPADIAKQNAKKLMLPSSANDSDDETSPLLINADDEDIQA